MKFVQHAEDEDEVRANWRSGAFGEIRMPCEMCGVGMLGSESMCAAIKSAQVCSMDCKHFLS